MSAPPSETRRIDPAAGLKIEQRPRGFVERLPLPSTRTLWLGGFAAATLSVSTALAATLAVALTLGCLLDARLVAREPGLRATVRGPRRLGQGQSDRLRIELRDGGERAQQFDSALVIDASLAAESTLETRRHVSAAGGLLELEFALLAARRGLHRVHGLALRRLGPLALIRIAREIPIDFDVEVVPGLRETRALRLRSAHASRSAGAHRTRLRGTGGTFESLREYARGDDPRFVDWKSTARRRTVMVRQFEVERSQNIMVAIDCGRAMAERFEDRERLDHALASAFALAQVTAEWGDRCGFMIFSDEVHALVPPSAQGWRHAATLLSAVEARPVEPDYPQALLELSHQLRRRSLVVVLSDVVDSAVSEPLARHLTPLARSHRVLFTAIGNPALVAVSGAPAESSADVYRRAAALELLDARAVSLAAMRANGIDVVDTRPEQALESVVDAYLDVKRRGRL